MDHVPVVKLGSELLVSDKSLAGFPADSADPSLADAKPEAKKARATPVAVNGSGVPPASRPRVLLAASGSVASIKLSLLATAIAAWADVKVVATKAALHFVDIKAVPAGVECLTDEDEWGSWTRLGDEVLHIELRKWADVMVVAPLSANTLAKMANGMCDNLLTCVVRAWDFSKPLLVAPAMNTFMWDSSFTSRHLSALEDLGVRIIPPVSKRLACGDIGSGAMAEPATIETAARTAVAGQLLPYLYGGGLSRDSLPEIQFLQ